LHNVSSSIEHDISKNNVLNPNSKLIYVENHADQSHLEFGDLALPHRISLQKAFQDKDSKEDKFEMKNHKKENLKQL